MSLNKINYRKLAVVMIFIIATYFTAKLWFSTERFYSAVVQSDSWYSTPVENRQYISFEYDILLKRTLTIWFLALVWSGLILLPSAKNTKIVIDR